MTHWRSGLVLGLWACGSPSSSVPAPSDGVPEAVIEARVEPSTAPPEPDTKTDAGPGGLSAPVAEAVARVFPQGRRLRCEVLPGLDAAGVLTAVRQADGQEEHLRAPTVDGGWFAAVAPTASGEGVVLRGGKVVAALAWTDASTGAWAACTLKPVARYQILGLVQTPAGNEVPNAQVRGCEAGAVARTNARGRFELQGVTGLGCGLVAVVDDAGGLGRSEPSLLRPVAPGPDGVPADVIVEISLSPERVAVDAVADQARRLHDLESRVLRNGLQAEVEGFGARIAAAELSAEARRVADGWSADLAARLAEENEVLTALGRADKAGLLAYWLHDR